MPPPSVNSCARAVLDPVFEMVVNELKRDMYHVSHLELCGCQWYVYNVGSTTLRHALVEHLGGYTGKEDALKDYISSKSTRHQHERRLTI